MYAVRSGIGIVAVSALGWLVFHERLTAFQIACGLMVLGGAVGLKLSIAR